MIDLFFSCVWFMMPAYFANMAPVFSKNCLKSLAKPIDFGLKIWGKPLLGKNKTFRGLIVGVLLAMIVAYLQFSLSKFQAFKSISLVSYDNFLLIGFLLGFGALFGDLVESFFKRRLGKKSGSKWIPFDQVDYTIGALIFILPVYVPPLKIIIGVLVINFCLHIIANHIGFCLRIKEVKW